MTDLLKCPFCNLSAGIFMQEICDEDDRTIAAHVLCDACDAQGPECKTVEAAAKMWNLAPRDSEQKTR